MDTEIKRKLKSFSIRELSFCWLFIVTINKLEIYTIIFANNRSLSVSHDLSYKLKLYQLNVNNIGLRNYFVFKV